MLEQATYVTVAAIIEENNKFLMVKENDNGQIVFNQPAGHWELGETVIEACIRETFEETGWHFQPTTIIGTYIATTAKGVTYVRICFTGNLLQFDDKHQLDTDIIETLWLSHDEIMAKSQQLRSAMVLRCINDYLAGIRYPLSSVTHL